MRWAWPCIFFTCHLLSKSQIMRRRHDYSINQPYWRCNIIGLNLMGIFNRLLKYLLSQFTQYKSTNLAHYHSSRNNQKGPNSILRLAPSSYSRSNPSICSRPLLYTCYRRSFSIISVPPTLINFTALLQKTYPNRLDYHINSRDDCYSGNRYKKNHRTKNA